MKRTTFKQPRQASEAADDWVRSGGEAQPASAPESPPAGKLARLTIDLPPELRDRFKAACAMQRTKMVDEVRRFIEEWTQKHGNP